MDPQWYGASHELTLPGLAKPITTDVAKITAIWAVEAALVSGILLVVAFGFRNIRGRLAEGSKTAVGGAILAAMNTASEYGFGAVIAALPGFGAVAGAVGDPQPAAERSDQRHPVGRHHRIGLRRHEHRAGGDVRQLYRRRPCGTDSAGGAAPVASMASGGMDTLPHNGAVITLLAITGLSHRQAYGGIFAITLIKSAAVLFVVGVFYLTGIV